VARHEDEGRVIQSQKQYNQKNSNKQYIIQSQKIRSLCLVISFEDEGRVIRGSTIFQKILQDRVSENPEIEALQAKVARHFTGGRGRRGERREEKIREEI